MRPGNTPRDNRGAPVRVPHGLAVAEVPGHRDSVLTDEEQTADDTMLICVSRSRSARPVPDP